MEIRYRALALVWLEARLQCRRKRGGPFVCFVCVWPFCPANCRVFDSDLVRRRLVNCDCPWLFFFFGQLIPHGADGHRQGTFSMQQSMSASTGSRNDGPSSVHIQLCDLPGDVIYRIASLLDLWTLLKSKAICKSWRDALSNEFMWKQLVRERVEAKDLLVSQPRLTGKVRIG